VAADKNLVTEISARGLGKTNKQNDPGNSQGKKVKASLLAKVVMGRQQE